MTNVPCNGCVRCCLDDLVRLLPEDFDGEGEARFKSTEHPRMPGHFMIDHQSDGRCIYLDDENTGCTIQEDKPRMCKDMDYRNIARQISFTHARKMDADGRLKFTVWQRGKELLGKQI